jgi:hypothetical protein
MTRRIMLAATLLALTCNSAMSEPNLSEARVWIEACRSNSTAQKMFCIGYLNGFEQAYHITTRLNDQTNKICIPDNVSPQEMLDVIIAHWHDPSVKQIIRQHPAFHVSGFVFLALTDRYPCPNPRADLNK